MFDKYYNLSLRFLSFRPRSEKEVLDYLKQKQLDQTIISQIIAKLKEHNFLNDREFANWFIDQRTRVKSKGLRLIKLELQQKGISQEIIEEAINDPQLTAKTDLERAKALLQTNKRKFLALDRQKCYQAAGSFLARRGFSWTEIKSAIDDLLQK